MAATVAAVAAVPSVIMDELDGIDIARLTNLLAGALLTHMVSAAAALGVADALGAEPAGSSDLARRCEVDADSLRRLLRGLGAIGVVEELGPDLFALTDMGHLLRSDHPRSLRSWAIIQGELMAPLWGGLTEAVRSGQPAAETVLGLPFYDHLAAHPDVDAHWNQAMAETAQAWIGDGGLLDIIDWSGVKRVLDVGGGHGALLAGLLRRHPHLSGVLFDLPHVVAGAAAILESAGVADRVEVLAGDMFESVPGGSDVYVLARVLFNWGNEQTMRLLRACHEAMGPGGRLLVIDQLVPDDDRGYPAKINDLNLLTIGGRGRSPQGWRDLAEAAGFEIAGSPWPGPTALPWVALVFECGDASDQLET